MADNVELDPGTGGAVVATDDAGVGGHVQIVKLALSANGSAVPITADAEGLLVKLTAQGGVDLMDVTVNNGAGASAVPIQDGGNTITVDGTVAVTHAGLTALNSAISGTEVQVDIVAAPTLTVDGSGVTQPVSNTTLTNAHSADFDTGAGTDTTPAFGIAVPASGGAVVVPGDATNGLKVQVTTAPSTAVTNAGTFATQATLQTGDNAVGRVKLTDGTDVADVLDLANSNPLTVAIVDGSGDQITSFGGGTQYTEDAAAAANPVGTVPILVRADTPATTTTTDGDNVAQRGSNYGAAYVTLVDSGGSFVSVGGGTQYDEDTVSGAADKLTMAGVVRKDTAASLVDTDGDRTQLQVDASGRLHVTVGNTVTVASHAVTNAGTFAVQVDGAALTALQLIDDPVATLGTTTYTEAATKGMIVGAVRRDADTTLVDTTNEVGPLQMDANGRLKVEAFSGETLPVSLASVPSHAVTNAGTFAVQVDGNALTALQKIDDPVLVDDAAFTPATSSVMMAGFEADESSTDSVDEGDAGAARMTLTRKLIVTPQPHTAGGCTPFYNIDVDETEDAIKASAGQLYELFLFNATTAPLYVKLYDATVANVTVGTTTPVMTIPVPANADSDGAGVVRNWPNGLAFANAITIAATTAAADNDTGAPAANAVMASGAYA